MNRRLLVSSMMLVAVTMVTTAQIAAAAPRHSHGGLVRQLAIPVLGDVKPVVKSTSHALPPRSVRFDGETLPAAASAPGEVVIEDVPGYLWHDGCGPTAVGMVVGYWDAHGYPDLVTGDASVWNDAAAQMIASHGSPETPGHYEDYSLPRDGATLLADRSESPDGDEHASDCVADFMHTSWSADGLSYGCSWSSSVGPAFSSYVKLRYQDSVPASKTYAGSFLKWDLVKAEIDAGRPMVFLVDVGGSGRPGHAVTVIGYREVNGYPEYGCWDEWDATLVRWEQYRPLSGDYAWGVWGGMTFAIGTATPEPTPTPTPAPTPTVTPTNVADVTPPVTTCSCRRHGTYCLSSVDDLSGVAHTYYSFDQRTWNEGITFKFPAKRRTAYFYSVDAAGNVEGVKSAQRL